MGVSEDITEIKVDAELHICPNCGYDHGFHTSFVNTETAKDNPVKSTRPLFRVILICPNCGSRYDAGWKIALGEGDGAIPKATILHHL